MLKLKTDLFTLAEQQLIKEKKEGIIPIYTLEDVIEYAIYIRKWLDKNEKQVKKVMTILTEKQRNEIRKKYRQEYYLTKGK